MLKKNLRDGGLSLLSKSQSCLQISVVALAFIAGSQQLDAKPKPIAPEAADREDISTVEARLLAPTRQANSSQTAFPSQHSMKPKLRPQDVKHLKVGSLNFAQSAVSVMSKYQNRDASNNQNAKNSDPSNTADLSAQFPKDIREQLQKLRSLSVDNRVELRFDRSRRISSLKGNFKLPASSTAEEGVSNIIKDHPAVFGIDTNTELELQAFCESESCTYKVNRRYRDLPMWGGDFTITTHRGQLVSAIGLLEVRDLDVEVEKERSDADIFEVVAAYFDRSVSDFTSQPTLERGIRAKRPFPTYVYRVTVEFSVMERYVAFVSVETGRVIEVLSQVYSTFYDSSGRDLNGQTRRFRSESSGGSYRLVDDQTPAGARTEVRDLQEGDLYDFASASMATASTPDGPWDPAAVSAIANAKSTTEYFSQVHDRNGLDGRGNGSKSAVNATYQGSGDGAWNTGDLLFYGSGGSTFSNTAAALDVAAHEFTHGVINSSSNLDYSFQSGALNESFADFFGATVDPDWTLGEDIVQVPPFYLRSMKDPESGLNYQPAHMSDYQYLTEDEDKGGVHINSGIPNRALYLIAEGLTSEGLGESIGRVKTEKIAYKTMITLPSTAEFTQAAEAMYEQAGILYGAQEKEAVKIAYQRVGLSVDAEESEPPKLPTPSTSNLAGAIYPYPDKNYLSVQLYDNNFAGYKADLFITFNTGAVALKRPSIATDTEGNGFINFFNDSNDLLYANIQTGEVEVLLSETDFQTITFAPGFTKFAGSLSSGNILGVCNFEKDKCDEYEIFAPSYSKELGDGVPAEVIDALDWDPTGRRVVFDFAICLEKDGDECEAYQWSIGILNTTTGQISYPYSSQPLSISLGNPSFSNMTDRYIAFDYVEADAEADNGIGYSSVLIYDSEEAIILYGPLPDASAVSGPNGNVMGFPSFTADDSGIIYNYLDDAGYPYVVYGEMNAYEWTGNGTYMDPYYAELPVSVPYLHKPLSLELVASPSRLNFADLNPNSSTSLPVCITNAGSARITTEPATANRNYVKPALGGVVLVGGKKTCGEIEVNTAGLAGGSKFSAVVDLPSDGDRLRIPISGNVLEVPPPSLGAFTTLLGTVEHFLNGNESTLSDEPPQPSAREASTQEVEGANPIPLLQTLGLWVLGALIGVLGVRRLRLQ